ncbi:34191_t:CDS:2, partial [Gigaspora margarita]
IGFITPLITELLSVSSIHCDAIYKTAKGQFELYGIISSIHECSNGLRTKALTSFLSSLCNKGLQLQHFFTDKDFAQINATKEVWPNINVQLCLWHVEKAIKEKIKSSKKIKQTQYQPSEAVKEFSFINPTFKPNLNQTNPEYYIICPIELQDESVKCMNSVSEITLCFFGCTYGPNGIKLQ